MKLFHRTERKKIDGELLYDDESYDTQIEQIIGSLTKSIPSNQNQYEEHDESASHINLISDKIKTVKDEYDNVLAELMPVKWELIEKKSEIDRIKSEYNATILELKSVKDQLYNLKSELLHIELELDVKRSELSKLQSESNHHNDIPVHS